MLSVTLLGSRLFLAALRASIPFNSTIKGSSLEGKNCFLGTHATVLVLCIRKIREAYGSTLEQND